MADEVKNPVKGTKVWAFHRFSDNGTHNISGINGRYSIQIAGQFLTGTATVQGRNNENQAFLAFPTAVSETTDGLSEIDFAGEVQLALTGATNASRPIALQDETNYDNTGSNGTFNGGASYAALDTITLSDSTLITVDAVSSGVVTEFTVTTPGATGAAAFDKLTQSSTSGSGTGFTLTLGTENASVNVEISLSKIDL